MACASSSIRPGLRLEWMADAAGEQRRQWCAAPSQPLGVNATPPKATKIVLVRCTDIEGGWRCGEVLLNGARIKATSTGGISSVRRELPEERVAPVNRYPCSERDDVLLSASLHANNAVPVSGRAAGPEFCRQPRQAMDIGTERCRKGFHQRLNELAIKLSGGGSPKECKTRCRTIRHGQARQSIRLKAALIIMTVGGSASGGHGAGWSRTGDRGSPSGAHHPW